MTVKFLIVGNLRCGATWLQGMLASIHGVCCDGELRWGIKDDVLKPYQKDLKQIKGPIIETLEVLSGVKVCGSKLLLDPEGYSSEEFQQMEDLLDRDLRIIHVQRNYSDALRSLLQDQGYRLRKESLNEKSSDVYLEECKRERKENSFLKRVSVSRCEQVIRSFYDNDLWVSQLEARQKHFIQVDYEEISEKFFQLLKFLSIRVSSTTAASIHSQSDFLKLEKVLEPRVFRYAKLKSVLDTYDKLRILQKNIKFLSPVARESVFSTYEKKIDVPSFNERAESKNFPVSVMIDIIPGESFLESLFLKNRHSSEPVSLLVIFSNFYTVQGLLTNPKYHTFIKEEVIRLWHSSEWEEKLNQELKNMRSPLHACESLISLKEHPISQLLEFRLKQAKQSYLKESEEHFRSLEKYYNGEGFERRVKDLVQGAKPRIYLDRACTSVAVKRFTDGCACALKELGFDVMVHEACRAGSIDFFHAVNYEIDQFKPDLRIMSPNFVKGYLSEYAHLRLPTVFSVQDLGPHFDYVKAIKELSLKEHEFLFYLIDNLTHRYLEAGASQKQLICDYLPIDFPSVNLQEYLAAPRFEVGYAKTMGKPRNLRQVIGEQNDELEVLIQRRVKQEGFWSLKECVEWGNDRSQQQNLINYYHESVSLHFVRSLKEAKFSMALTGDGWEGYEDLLSSSLGHAEDREDYQVRFLDNQINLSINPFVQYHPRIIEGGVCGAFFLVFYVPEEVSWCPMPEGMLPGKHFDFFTSAQDLIEKCEYYTKRPDLCLEIGGNLKNFVEDNFSYQRLCQQFLEKFNAFIHSTQIMRV